MYNINEAGYLDDYRVDICTDKTENPIAFMEDGYYVDGVGNQYLITNLKVLDVLRNNIKYKLADKDQCGLWRICMSDNQTVGQGALA